MRSEDPDTGNSLCQYADGFLVLLDLLLLVVGQFPAVPRGVGVVLQVRKLHCGSERILLHAPDIVEVTLFLPVGEQIDRFKDPLGESLIPEKVDRDRVSSTVSWSNATMTESSSFICSTRWNG